MNRAKAERILRTKFNKSIYNTGQYIDHTVRFENRTNSPFLCGLCLQLPPELSPDWERYWSEVVKRYSNTKKYGQCIRAGQDNVMYHFFNHNYDYAEITLLRLLSAHLFIRDQYEE